jgi:hypothetical protein
LAHMTGTYDTGKLPDLYRKFAYASQLTPKTLPQFTNALSYAMPSLVGGMGMDPDAVMFLTAMNQSAGIGSSKAGTWIQSFFSKLMPDMGINLTKSQQGHNNALRGMGLLDENNKTTWMVPGVNGKTDWLASLMKLSPLLGSGLAAMPDTQRMALLDQVFGKQGGREAGLFNLKEFIGQFPALAGQLKMARGGEDVLKELSEGSVAQQARNAWTDTKIVLMDIATVALPPVTAGLKVLDEALKGLRLWTPPTGPDNRSKPEDFTVQNARPMTWGDKWRSLWGDASTPTNNAGGDTTVNMNLDGEKIGSIVLSRFNKELGRAPTGPTWFDPTVLPSAHDSAFAIP